jgi:oligopeptide transport system ATP-binding protein
MKLLEVEDLEVHFSIQGQLLPAVRRISFQLDAGESVGIVGESGSGKSSAVQALTRLSTAEVRGNVWFQGEELLSKKETELRKIRGRKIGMVFQDPMSSLNPTMKIGAQIKEGLIYHNLLSEKEALKRAAELLDLVGVPEPLLRLDAYPHTLSGGMRQRVLIAIAIACNPCLLIADEPTTALDPPLALQIVSLLQKVQKTLGTALLFITHDLKIVARICTRLLVMYAGEIVEEGPTLEILERPKHPYTKRLLEAALKR